MSPWRRRADRRSGDMAHGITFIMHERSGGNVRAEAAIASRKVHLDGTGALTLALDQYKYGDELIAQLYTQAPHRALDRRADGWNRVQIYLGPADISAAETLEAIAAEIRARLSGRRS